MWLSLLARFWYAPIILCLFLWGEWWHHEAKDAKSDLATMKVQVEANGKIAEANAKLKEAEYDKNLSAATAGRDDAYKRVQLAEAAVRAASSRVPYRPITAQASGKQCIDPASIAPAIESFRRTVAESRRQLAGLVAEGDRAQADAKALIDAWPK